MTLKIDRLKYPFSVWQNTTLNSHRSLIQDFLGTTKGVILNLANKDCKKTGIWFASTLIDHDFRSTQNNLEMKFKVDIKSYDGIKDLITKACRLSPVKQAYFLTDYQFGGKPKNLIVKTKIEQLWFIHDEDGLTWNTCMYYLFSDL